MNSNFRRRLLRRGRSGISEVVGALLLMIVVVVAVGTFAYYLNNLQNQTQNRQSFQNNVANDKLQITQLQFSLSNPSIQYEIFNRSNPSFRFYIQDVSPLTVILVNEKNGTANSTNLYETSPTKNIVAFYNNISSSATADLTISPTTPWIINFTTSSSPGPFSFRIATWGNATITVRNLNTATSGIKGIEVNGSPLGAQRGNYWFPIGIGGKLQYVNTTTKAGYNFTGPSLTLPAKSSVNLLLNLSSLSIPRNTNFQIVMLSTIGNYFTTFYADSYCSNQDHRKYRKLRYAF